LGPRGSARAHLDREVRFGAEKHVAASEHSSRGDRVRRHETRDNIKTHLDREARSRAEEHVEASKLNSTRR
jgi:hypothetical protein